MSDIGTVIKLSKHMSTRPHELDLLGSQERQKCAVEFVAMIDSFLKYMNGESALTRFISENDNFHKYWAKRFIEGLTEHVEPLMNGIKVML